MGATAFLQRLRDRSLIRQQIALIAGLLCVLAVTAAASTAAVLARRQAVADTDAALVTLARTLAQRLDIRMSERYREIRNVANLPPLATIWEGPPEAVRGVLAQLQTTLPEYAWIGFASPEGVVRAATKGMLEGVSVAHRPWFINGLEAPTVEDVHDAKLLDKLLRTSVDQAPFRFVDVAVPVRDPTGQLAGVLGAHMSWTWADEVRRDVLSNDITVADASLWVISANGEVLIGPSDARRFDPELIDRARASNGIAIVDDTGGEPILTAIVSTKGRDDYPGLGWLVVARSPVSTALATANQLFVVILSVGVFVALIGAFLALLMAGRTMRPLERLIRDIDRIGRDENTTMVSWQHGSQDALTLSASIRSLLRRLSSTIASERATRENAATAQDRAAEQLRLAEEEARRLGRDIDELQRLAGTDPLTGLLNRRAFAPFAEDAMNYVRHDRMPAAVVMFDIDHFKSINDTYGHAAGDGVLRGLATMMSMLIRETDKAARFGGEEFVVLLRGIAEGEAVHFADRMREVVATTPIPNNGTELRITVSAGVASLRAGDRDFDDAVERADRALYVAKTTGRNRVVNADDSSSTQGA